jgi:putative spermidine/putrescine transport system permease protein
VGEERVSTASRGWSRYPLAAWSALVLAFLLAPLVIAVAVSFSSGERIEFPPPGLSLRWYRELLGIEAFRTGLLMSLGIGAAVAVVSAVCGTAAAIAFNHFRFKGRSLAQSLTLLPLALPGVVLGLALLSTLGMLGLRPGPVATALGHSVLGVPYVAYLVLASLANYDLSLEQASLNLGASRFRTFMRITLPLIAPGVLGGAVCAFLISFDNVALSLFLARGDTLPLRLIQHIQFSANPSVAAMSTVLVAISFLAMLPLATLIRGRTIVRLAG